MSKNTSLFSSTLSEGNTSDKKHHSSEDTNISLSRDINIDCNPKEILLKKTFIIPLIFLILFIIIEPFYRKPLYELTDNFASKWQKFGGNIMDISMSIITQFGGTIGIGINIFIFYFFFPLMTSYIFISLYVICLYFDMLMKIIYKEIRPFLEYPQLFKECEAGYGNPSGHSFGSVFIYLSLYSLLSKTKWMKSHSKCKYTLLVFVIILSSSVCLSRIYLVVHSINQVVYGACLGLTFYMICCWGLKLQKIKFTTYRKIFVNIKCIIIAGIVFLILLMSLIMVYCLGNFEESLKYIEPLQKLCKDMDKNRYFQHDGMYGGLLIFAVIGGWIGQIILWYKIQSSSKYKDCLIEANEWNKGPFDFKGNYKKYLIEILILGGSAIIPLIMLMVVNHESMWIVFTFKVAVPSFLLGLCLFGIDIYLIVIYAFEPEDNHSNVTMEVSHSV